MANKQQLEFDNMSLRSQLSASRQNTQTALQRCLSLQAEKDGYIRAFKALIKLFPQFAAYKRRDAEDAWGTLYADLIAEDMERIQVTRDEARKRRLFGDETREK